MTKHFSAAVLDFDPAAETERIAKAMRESLRKGMRRRGLVIGLSGGIDSSVCAGLAARALGASNVFAVLMPESDSDPESLRLGSQVADTFGIDRTVEDMAPNTDDYHYSAGPATDALELAQGQFARKGLRPGSRLLRRKCRSDQSLGHTQTKSPPGAEIRRAD